MDPLAQLHDIHLPEQIHNYPVAPGWWLVTIIALTVSIWLIRKFIQHRQFNRHKKNVTNLLKAHKYSNAEIIIQLKSVAIHYYAREDVACLYGSKLALFLQKKLPDKHQENFKTMIHGQLENHYQLNNEDQYSLIEAAQFWLKHARLKQIQPLENGGNA